MIVLDFQAAFHPRFGKLNMTLTVGGGNIPRRIVLVVQSQNLPCILSSYEHHIFSRIVHRAARFGLLF